MKKFATVGLALSLMAAMFVSCGECYEKMQKNQDQIQVTCNPEVLVLKGSNVSTDITVSFPENYFNKETILKITPVLVYEGGELVGTTKYVQGEDVVGNYTTISRFEGGSYSQNVVFPFVKEAAMGTLELRIEAKCYDDCKETADFVPVATLAAAKGISAIQNLANNSIACCDNACAAGGNGLAVLEHNFQRASTTSQEAEILYKINSSVVNKKQLTAEQIALFKDFVAANSTAERTTLSNIYASGYASPDGPEKFNNKLSEQRSKTGAKAIKKELKAVEGLNYEIASYGEDWDGFKTLVENSNIEEKDLILNVLQMYSSPVERDKEIQNMSAVFKVLAEEILPQLRRTRFAVEATYAGLTDEEILAAAKAGDNNLDIEHLLYAATLTNDKAEKAAIYEFAAATYHDARAYNNLAVVKAQQGDLNAAKTAFEKAAQMGASSEVANNLATVAVAMGDLEAAKKYLAGVESEAAKANKGAIALAEGNYQEAKANLKGYNLAVAELCDNNIEAAKAAIAEVKGADADYIRAIIANREGETEKAVAYLKSAVAAKPALKAQAENDIEFAALLAENAL
jgi:Flp pilus assembly protein TadD/outer membrane protein OmpA-like peptidoglycan-associated protein